MSNIKFQYYNIKGQCFRILRHIPIIGGKCKRKKYGNKKILDIEVGRKVIVEAIRNNAPFMVGRFGTSEGCSVYSYLRNSKLTEINVKELTVNAGFFPNDRELLNKFCVGELEACKNLDMLGVMGFLGEEYIVDKYAPNALLMHNNAIATGRYGWGYALEGKKVLVIHPFTDTIQKQYFNNREHIFPDSNALPEFDLKCIKAVQTIADQEDERFENWFEALDYMAEEASKVDFDVALIGCGAYGFQLASRIKDMGKVAIHMGGSLQTLFGIKGSRWDKTCPYYNEYWVYPSEDEKPAGYEKVEGGCYWKV